MNKAFKNLAIYMIIVLLAVSFLRFNTIPRSEQVEMTYESNYNELVEGAAAGKIESIEITTYGEYQKAVGKTKDGKGFSMTIPSDDKALLALLLEHDVQIIQKETPEAGFFVSLLSTLLPVLLIMGLFFFMMQQSQGGGGKVMQFGKSKAKVNIDDKNRVTFRDVAGADEVKEELEEVVEFLKSPKKFVELGAKIPKGVLLYDLPEQGKHCWLKRLPVKLALRFSLSAVRTLWKCSSVWGHLVCGIYLSKPKRILPVLSLLTKLMRSADREALALAADTMSGNKR